jgi:outer membrane murein-binding lipoprotein Lpp
LHHLEGCGKIITMKPLKFSWKYAIIILGIILLAYLVLDFNSRMANMRNLSTQRDRVATQLSELEQEQARLSTQIAFATSDAAVVQWAYGDGRMVRAGDNPVIPLPPAESTPVPPPAPMITQPVVDNWQIWMWLFVDRQ